MEYKIEDLFEFIRNGVNIKQGLSGGYPITRIETISTGEINRNKMGYAGITDIGKFENYILEHEDILMSHINSEKHLGKCALYEKKENEQIIHGMNLLGLRVKRGILLPKFAIYLFQTQQFRKSLSKIVKKSVNQASFAVNDLKKIKLDIPYIEQQKYIVAVLDSCNRLIEKRQSQITALDELTQSLFLEMFGDPIQNIKKFKQMPIKNVISDIQTGWSPVASKEPATNNEPGVLKLSAVTGGRYNFKENKKLLDGTPFKSEYEVNVGDILLTRKNTKELVGACSYIFETSSKLMFSDLIFKLIIKNITLIEPIYLWRLLNNNSMKKELSKLASGSSGSMPNISKKNLNELLIVVPPIELQKEFVNKIISLEKIRNDFINSLSSYEILYNSLLQKAFKGEPFQEQ
ncbi:restriction endonuclease subunit S [Paenibacillus sp. BT-177]|uniref:restriction endonuclease subunit S n=1 Tax=Paenibacillus sp. BT-177 TaxID=2986930 RepID=UPI0021F7CA60|nr:restriction endonuclease subunit S [Paenibacillus sp. BT-177]